MAEIGDLNVLESGTDEGGVPYLKLMDGPHFSGFSPSSTERSLYRAISAHLPDALVEDAFRVAIDVVTRYRYPHAMAASLPLFPRFKRYAFHPQHITTIHDAKNIDAEEKQRLIKRFSPKLGDTVVEAGSFLGFGAMRLSEIVGNEGLVVAIEALPEAQRLLERNLEQNEITNVRLIRKAVSDRATKTPLLQRDLQANSIVTGMISGVRSSQHVETDSIDAIVDDMGLDRVDFVSLTINGAEIEALLGMEQVCKHFRPCISSAGWYKRDGRDMYERQVEILRSYDYQTLVIGMGRVLGWRD